MTQLRFQPIRGQSETCKQLSTDASIPTEGHEHMRNIDQSRTPALPSPLCRLQQFFKVFPDEQLIATTGRLFGEHVLQTVKQIFGAHGQWRDPAAKSGVTEQHLEQMLHIQLLMAPTAGYILTREQEIPGLIAEAIGLMRKAAPSGGGSRHSAQVSAREESSINSTL